MAGLYWERSRKDKYKDLVQISKTSWYLERGNGVWYGPQSYCRTFHKTLNFNGLELVGF